MTDPDHWQTIAVGRTAEITIKSSRFVGESFRVETVEAAKARLEAVRTREYDATHHCYAWRVGIGTGLQEKLSDDGEPSGTAGKPIMELLQGRQLTNTLVVVTRYFGGTKLGTGGLRSAYADTARQVLELSGVETQFRMSVLRVSIGFALLGRVRQLLKQLGAEERNATFNDMVSLRVAIRQSRAEELQVRLIDVCGGKIAITACE